MIARSHAATSRGDVRAGGIARSVRAGGGGGAAKEGREPAGQIGGPEAAGGEVWAETGTPA